MLRNLLSMLIFEPAAVPIMAANSRTATYPFKGMAYFIKTPLLWGNLVMMAIPQLVLTFVVFSLVYIFLYPPQAAIALLFNGPTGVIAAWIGMLQEALAFTQIISSIVLMPTPLRIMFDTILSNEGYDEMVYSNRGQAAVEEFNHHKVMKFAKALPRRLLLPKWFFKISFRVVMNFIPLFGPIVLIICDAKGTARRCLGRYFELQGLDKKQVEHYVRKNRGQFLAFGLIAATLEALPFIGLLFMYTNTCGGALWASDTEQRLRPNRRTAAKKRFEFLFD